jgi:hypothetical protein
VRNPWRQPRNRCLSLNVPCPERTGESALRRAHIADTISDNLAVLGSAKTALAFAAVVVNALVIGCASAPNPDLNRTFPSRVSHPSSAPQSPSTKVRFTACGRVAAEPASTNLKAIAITDKLLAHGGPYDVTHVPTGPVTLEHATDLLLSDGRIEAGNGYEAATATGAVADVARKGVVAPVTLAVLNSKASGRRVGFVEVRLAASAPVRWSDMTALTIGTDGGDGGFTVGGAPQLGADDASTLDYVDAFYPNRNSYSGNVCVLRQPVTAGRPDAVLFETGYGDGGYPTVGGYDGSGHLVSLVSYGFVVPWRLSGLPGTPPKEVLEEAARHH